MPDDRIWWETLSDEERNELHRYFAEVNRINDQIAGTEEDRAGAVADTTAAF